MTSQELADAWRELGQPMTTHHAERILASLTPSQCALLGDILAEKLRRRRRLELECEY